MGDYRPDYIYYIIETYKQNYPFLPIILKKNPTPVYQLTKIINHLTTPYISSKYNIKLTLEGIQILNELEPNKETISSLDVENLFTNIPVSENIDITIIIIYNNPFLPPFKIRPCILRIH